jgi:hypothetical protein
MARKWLLLSDDNGGNDDSFDSLEEESSEEEEEEVSSEETSMNQLDTSEEKLFARCTHGMLFSDDGNIPSTSSDPHTPKSRDAPRRRAAMMTTTTSRCR